MEIQQDYRDLLQLFNAHKVEYIIVGAYALAFHGVPRFTGDIDIFIRPSAQNAQSVLKALDAFGFGSLELTESDFAEKGKVVQLGVPPVRIDILTSITEVEWEEAVKGKVEAAYGDIVVSYIGRKEFLKNKRSTGRSKDIADCDALT